MAKVDPLSRPLLEKQESRSMSAKALIQHERNIGLWEAFKTQDARSEEAAILDFVIKRLEFHSSVMGKTKGQHSAVECFHNLVVEFSEVDNFTKPLEFQVLGLLTHATDSIEPLAPLPDPSELVVFLDDVWGLCQTAVPDYKNPEDPDFDSTLYGFGNEWYKEVKGYGDAKIDLKPHKEAARKCALDGLEAIAKKHDRFPILRFFVEALTASITDRNNFTLFTYWWAAANKQFKPDVKPLRWTMIGSLLAAAIETDCLTDSDIASATLEGFDDLRNETLPLMTLRLTQLRAALQTNIDQGQNIKNKVLAGMMTGGITLGQMLGNWIMKTPHHEGCGCD